MAFWNSSMMKTFLCGSLLGGIGAFLTMHYHVVRTDETVLFVPRVHQPPLRTSYADVRAWSPAVWQEFPDLSQAIVKAGRQDLLVRDGSKKELPSVFPNFFSNDQISERPLGQPRTSLLEYPAAPMPGLTPIIAPLTPASSQADKLIEHVSGDRVENLRSDLLNLKNPFFQNSPDEMPYPLQPIETTQLPTSPKEPIDLLTLLQDSETPAEQTPSQREMITASASSTLNSLKELINRVEGHAEAVASPVNAYIPLESLIAGPVEGAKLPLASASTIPEPAANTEVESEVVVAALTEAAPPADTRTVPVVAEQPAIQETITTAKAAFNDVVQTTIPQESIDAMTQKLIAAAQGTARTPLQNLRQNANANFPDVEQLVQEVIARTPVAPPYQVPTTDWVFASMPGSEIYSEGVTEKVASAELAPHFQSIALKTPATFQMASVGAEGIPIDVPQGPAPSQLLRRDVGYATLTKSLNGGHVKAIDDRLVSDFQPNFPMSPRRLPQ